MTALKRYDLLEAAGWYSERAGDAPREVLVTFGDATLTILRFDETPIAHWPLGSLAEVAGPAALTVAPDPEAPERLALDDRDMVGAIRALRPDLGARPPRRLGRRGRRALALAGLALAAVGLWQGAPALVAALAAATPPAARAALGEAAVDAFAGPARCRGAAGVAALDRFAAQAAAATGRPVRLAALSRPGPGGAAALPAPGGWVALFPAGRADAEALTASVAAALADAAARPPTAAALRDAGGAGLLGALTGRLDAHRLTEAAAARLHAPAPLAPAPDAARLAAEIGAPALSPADWAALRAICD